MDAVRQVKQRSTGPPATVVDEGALVRQGALDSAVVVRDDGGGRQAQRPLNLSTAVMIAAVIAVEEQGNPFGTDVQLRLQET